MQAGREAVNDVCGGAVTAYEDEVSATVEVI